MKIQSSRQIARIKLTELNQQYQNLTKSYDELQKSAQQASSPEEKLKILYEGLDQIKFAQKKLHPDIENLHVLKLETDTGLVSQELLALWLDRLEKEIEQGKHRLEAGLLFGLSLEDAARQSEKKLEQPGKTAFESFFVQLIQGQRAELDETAFRNWIKEQIGSSDKIQKGIQEFMDEEVLKPVSKNEAEYLIRAMKAHPYHHTYLKSEISGVIGNGALINELAGTVTILLNNFCSWNWPEEGVDLNCLWTKNKWRPYNQGDLLNALFLEVVGMRWGMLLRKLLIYGDLYGSYPPYPDLGYLRRQITDNLFLKEFPQNLDYDYVSFNDTYEYNNTSLIVNAEDSYFNLFQGLNGEVKTAQLNQALDKDKGLYVLHTDFKDYFLTIPHHLLVIMMEEFGVSEEWIQFFKKYFQTPYHYNSKITQAKQGLSLSYVLSSLFADLTLMFLEKSFDSQEVAVYRYMDDMYLFSESAEHIKGAWSKINEYCTITGLSLNKEKTGATFISKSGKADDTFLQEFGGRLPQWMFLELKEDGQWYINPTSVEEYKQNMVAQLKAQSSIFSFVTVYNKHVSFLLKGFAVGFPIRENYLQEVAQVISTLTQNLFGNQQSIDNELQRMVIAKFPQMNDVINNLPKAWFYWPITAGGLALDNPMCNIAALWKSHQDYQQELPDLEQEEDDTQVKYQLYNYFNQIRVTTLTPQNPVSTPMMEGLMNDFIERGGEVTGREQKGLSPYWRWLLYTYGHELLDSFGTFRFLLTELVPLEVIFKSLSDQEGFGLGEPVIESNDDSDIPF